MKNILCLFVLLICCMTFISCGQIEAYNVSTDKPEKSSAPTQLPKESKESSVPTQPSEEPKESAASKNGEVDRILGKWKILDMIGNGYIYGDVSMEDYVGGIVTISENNIESDLPMGKTKLNNPEYKFSKQDENDFWEYRHANMDNGFGFKNNQIELVEVYDDNDTWDEFGGIFWVRDKKHLIFLGPVYFLAEKVE